MRQIILLLILSSIFINGIAKTIDFDSLSQRLSEHPKIAQLLANQDYFNQMADAKIGLPQPNIILGVDNVPINDPAFDEFLPTSKVLGIRQQFPSKQLRKSRSQEQLLRAKKNGLNAKFQTQRLKALLQNQFINLNKTNKIYSLEKSKSQIFTAIEKDLDGQLAAGIAVFNQLETLNIERNKNQQRLSELSGIKAQITAQIHSLLGETLSTKIQNSEIDTIELLNWSNSDQLYPVLIARQNIDIAKQTVQSAEAQNAPNYSLQALYKQRESSANFRGDDWVSVQASVSLPLWSQTKIKATKRAAMAKQRAAQFELDATLRDIKANLAQLKARYISHKESYQLLTQRKRPLTQKRNALERRYSSGEISQQPLLQTEIELINLKIETLSQYALMQTVAAQYNSYIVGENHDK